VRPPRLPLADGEREKIKSILRRAMETRPGIPVLHKTTVNKTVISG